MLIPIGLTLAGLFFNLTHERKITSSENSFLVFHRYKPAKLVADGSNGPWNLALWGKTCAEQGVEFYNTREKGALRISL